VLESSGLGKVPNGPKRQCAWVFQGPGTPHNFAEQARHFSPGQRPGVLFHNTAQYWLRVRQVENHILPGNWAAIFTWATSWRSGHGTGSAFINLLVKYMSISSRSSANRKLAHRSWLTALLWQISAI